MTWPSFGEGLRLGSSIGVEKGSRAVNTCVRASLQRRVRSSSQVVRRSPVIGAYQFRGGLGGEEARHSRSCGCSRSEDLQTESDGACFGGISEAALDDVPGPRFVVAFAPDIAYSDNRLLSASSGYRARSRRVAELCPLSQSTRKKLHINRMPAAVSYN